MAGIYLHIPYCTKACYYCDFHFSTNLKSKQDMVKALAEELRLRNTYLGKNEVETIYFGGGTPSLLSPEELRFLLNIINDYYNLSRDPEITLEANPDNISKPYLEQLLQLGINRMSMGTQSFNEQHLVALNRSHSAQQSKESLSLIREAGFDNYTTDLIYGIPSIDHDIWIEDIEQMLSFAPPHMSCYNLTIEPNTVFGKWVKSGKFIEADDQFAYEQFDLLMNRLSHAGYDHYEISNFSKPGYRSKHNSNYWNNEQYLGVGPGAHSYDHATRQSNVSNNALYIKSVKGGKIPTTKEILTKNDQINESIMTSIRTSTGINLQDLSELYGYDLCTMQKVTINQLKDAKYIEIINDHIVLTKKGKFLADAITEKLFVD